MYIYSIRVDFFKVQHIIYLSTYNRDKSEQTKINYKILLSSLHAQHFGLIINAVHTYWKTVVDVYIGIPVIKRMGLGRNV